MKKNYINPMTKVVSLNMNMNLMDRGNETVSGPTENHYSDAPLF